MPDVFSEPIAPVVESKQLAESDSKGKFPACLCPEQGLCWDDGWEHRCDAVRSPSEFPLCHLIFELDLTFGLWHLAFFEAEGEIAPTVFGYSQW
jgi:hypothetical protein